MELVDLANKYIEENKKKVIKTFRNSFHMEPTIGWMNDPNGLVHANNEFHIYYQANPYNTFPQNMAWGHFVSKDLIKYEDKGIAMYPEGNDKETDCFTGSAFVENNKIRFVYTQHCENKERQEVFENQYICDSKDFSLLEKSNKPCVDVNELPKEISRRDFRDPQIFYRDGICYLLIGSHTIEDKGVFVVYSGKNSEDLHYDFYFGPYENTHCMVECPCLTQIGGYDVIIFSSYGLNSYINGHSVNNKSYYMVGKLDLRGKKFDVYNSSSIDSGDAFYAPKLIENVSDVIMIGWMDKWEQEHKTHLLNHNWVGSYSIPRILSLEKFELKQTIIPSLFNYCLTKKQIRSGEHISKHSYSKFSFKNNFDLRIVSSDGELHLFSYDGSVMFDTTKSNNLDEMVFKSKFDYKSCDLEVLLDTSSIEIFINNGKETITSRYYFEDDNLKLVFSGIDDFYTSEIEVK